MGIRVWLLGKGFVGSIARALCTNYLNVKEKRPQLSEDVVLDIVWKKYLEINISESDSIKKGRILKHMFFDAAGNPSVRVHNSLIDTFISAVYIETNISEREHGFMKSALKVFQLECKKMLGIDFESKIKARLEVNRSINMFLERKYKF